MQSDLTTQSADIILAWIGNRHTHTDALLQKQTLAVVFYIFFFITEEEHIISDAHFYNISIL